MIKRFVFIIICLLIVTGCSLKEELNNPTTENDNKINIQENNNALSEKNNNHSNSSGGEIDEGGIY